MKTRSSIVALLVLPALALDVRGHIIVVAKVAYDYLNPHAAVLNKLYP